MDICKEQPQTRGNAHRQALKFVAISLAIAAATVCALLGIIIGSEANDPAVHYVRTFDTPQALQSYMGSEVAAFAYPQAQWQANANFNDYDDLKKKDTRSDDKSAPKCFGYSIDNTLADGSISIRCTLGDRYRSDVRTFEQYAADATAQMERFGDGATGYWLDRSDDGWHAVFLRGGNLYDCSILARDAQTRTAYLDWVLAQAA